MSSLISPKLCNTPLLKCNKTRFFQPLQIRAQIHRDHEGRSGNIVDANLHLLKVRVEEVRSKERLERCCVAEQGWNYAAYDSFKTKTDTNYTHFYQEFVELLGVVGATFGITISGCTLCICLFSILLHFNQ
ncbi:uncharacterized protein LOC125202856 [Salvia hispanica]|uniref:uncharacterized protein LOC125202856 n=1 Tax=Salvia hispanica TaxID=49212 RepID=UPI0020092798|nr:uncharacterized protein LOC125202856 [Salvia hispanica]